MVHRRSGISGRHVPTTYAAAALWAAALAVSGFGPAVRGGEGTAPPAANVAAPADATAGAPVAAGGGDGVFAYAPDAARTLSAPAGARPRVLTAEEPPKTLDALAARMGADFRCVRRGDFLVASDVGDKDFDVLVDGILAYASAALRRMFFDAPPADPVAIYVFRDTDSYARSLERLFGIRPVSPYGHYAHARNDLVVNYETGPGTLVHELVHALMAADFPDAPIWISEGMASLFEQCRVEGGRLVGETNWRLPELQRALAENRAPALAGLLRTAPAAFRADGESLRYATVRYFCQYLQERGLLADVYRRFRDGRRADPTGRRAVEAAAGEPLAALERRFHAWAAALEWK